MQIRTEKWEEKKTEKNNIENWRLSIVIQFYKKKSPQISEKKKIKRNSSKIKILFRARLSALNFKNYVREVEKALTAVKYATTKKKGKSISATSRLEKFYLFLELPTSISSVIDGNASAKCREPDQLHQQQQHLQNAREMNIFWVRPCITKVTCSTRSFV